MAETTRTRPRGTPSLTAWIFIAMVVGGVIGHYFPHVATNLQVLYQIFLRLIKTIIAPLLFGTLVSGIAGHADLKKVGRMGIKSIVYFEIITTLALIIGLTAINLSRAGEGVQIGATAASKEALPTMSQNASDIILHAFPENIAKAIADGQVLQVVVFSIIFAIGLALVRDEGKRHIMLGFCESLTEVMFKFTNIVMLFAPIGVGAAIAYLVATSGFGLLGNLAKLVATLYIALFIFLGGVLLPVALFFRVPIKRFIHAVSEPATIAFSTTSSEAALPRAMEAMEAMGVPRGIVAFVIPTGYSFNMDGGTLYLSLAAMFVAQAAGIHLSIWSQVYMMVILMLTSKGIAGVSRGSLIVLMASAAQLGLPMEPILVLLGVDHIMDMGRTSVNVIGNCLASVVIAKWEGDFEKEAPSQRELASGTKSRDMAG